MRLTTALAAALLTLATLSQVPALASDTARAQLRLVIVDGTNAAIPAATVTIYTLDGNPATIVTANEYGVATFPALPLGMAQIFVKSQGFSPFIDKTTLEGGQQAQTITLTPKQKKYQTSAASSAVLGS
jgi:hypothetical protein